MAGMSSTCIAAQSTPAASSSDVPRHQTKEASYTVIIAVVIAGKLRYAMLLMSSLTLEGYFVNLSHFPSHYFLLTFLFTVVILFLGLCAGLRMIFKRGEATSSGRYVPVFLQGEKSNRPILDDFSTHAPDRLLEGYRDRVRDNSLEGEQEVVRESDLQEIVLNPIIESFHPPAPVITPDPVPVPVPNDVISHPDEAPKKAALLDSK